MDAAHKSKRKFPSHTTAELEAAIPRETNLLKQEAMIAEVAARKRGDSKPFATPQIGAPTCTTVPCLWPDCASVCGQP